MKSNWKLMTTKTLTTGQPIMLHGLGHVPDSFCPETELCAIVYKKLVKQVCWACCRHKRRRDETTVLTGRPRPSQWQLCTKQHSGPAKQCSRGRQNECLLQFRTVHCTAPMRSDVTSDVIQYIWSPSLILCSKSSPPQYIWRSDPESTWPSNETLHHAVYIG